MHWQRALEAPFTLYSAGQAHGSAHRHDGTVGQSNVKSIGSRRMIFSPPRLADI
jgi:hypothetical protein